MAVLGLTFNDFKALSGRHRIYYYEGVNHYDFHFLVDGQIIKSTVMKAEIDNMERFFSDKMFYGAMRITFNIPTPREDPFSVVNEGIKTELDLINVFQDEEVKDTDVQREGVDMDETQ